jgi:hypothetical protein
VLHPHPFFARLHGEGGREPRWASHTALVLLDRSSTPPEGRNIGVPRWFLHCSTQRRRWPQNLCLFLHLLHFLFSCCPPALFSLLLPGGRSFSGGPSCGMRHQPKKSQIHCALCNAARENRVDTGFWFERSQRHPSPMARWCPLQRGMGHDPCGCDHTSVNAPDPTRSLQLSALGLE